jgi:hypothetical protein
MTGDLTGSWLFSHPAVPRPAPLIIMMSPLGRSNMSPITRAIGMSSMTQLGFSSLTFNRPHVESVRKKLPNSAA